MEHEYGQEEFETKGDLKQLQKELGDLESNKEVVSAVVHAVQPGLQPRSYLENMTELTLPRLRKILRFHFHENNATELYQLLTNITQQPNDDPQSFLMKALTIRQKVISASKESGSGIKYDASSVQSLFLQALETGLADETIRAKVRPLTQNPQVADEDLTEVMGLATTAETKSLASKGKSAKVYTVESPADTSTKKEQQKDQHILTTPKAVQADLASVRSEVETLRETAISEKADSLRPARLGNSVTMGARSLGCQECRRNKEGDRWPRCYLCGGPNRMARYYQANYRSHPENAGQGVASPEEQKSRQCSGCLKF